MCRKTHKSRFIKKQINYPKIHDLETLLNILDNNSINLNPNRNLLIELSDYAVEGRYTIMHDDLENVQNIFILLNNMVKESHAIVYED